MDGLIEQLETATGPDVDIDGDIWRLFPPGTSPYCPSYTESIDDALTLVPEGADLCVYFSDRTKRAITDKFRPWHVEVEIGNRVHIGRSDHGAIAVCIAALKARSAMTTAALKSNESAQMTR